MAIAVVTVSVSGEIRWQFETGPPLDDILPVSKVLDGLGELAVDIRNWRRNVWAESEE